MPLKHKNILHADDAAFHTGDFRRATMRLTPSLWRTNWMTISKDELIIWRMAFSWMETPEREIMSPAQEGIPGAWHDVVMEPSCPVFMAWSMS